MRNVDQPSKHTEYMRRWREKNREKTDAYQAQWRKDNAEHIVAYSKAKYAAKDKAEHRAQANAYYAKNKERLGAAIKAAAANQRYVGRLTVADVEAAIEKSGRKCHWCGKTDLEGRDLTLEHIERRNAPEAIVIACFSCNCSRKSPAARIVNQWGRSK